MNALYSFGYLEWEVNSVFNGITFVTFCPNDLNDYKYTSICVLEYNSHNTTYIRN